MTTDSSVLVSVRPQEEIGSFCLWGIWVFPSIVRLESCFVGDEILTDHERAMKRIREWEILHPDIQEKTIMCDRTPQYIL